MPFGADHFPSPLSPIDLRSRCPFTSMIRPQIPIAPPSPMTIPIDRSIDPSATFKKHFPKRISFLFPGEGGSSSSLGEEKEEDGGRETFSFLLLLRRRFFRSPSHFSPLRESRLAVATIRRRREKGEKAGQIRRPLGGWFCEWIPPPPLGPPEGQSQRRVKAESEIRRRGPTKNADY